MSSALHEKDQTNSGQVLHDDFIRCLSRSNMKCTEREVQILVSELDVEKTGNVNYSEFLKFSYLSQMFIYHFKLELMLREMDKEENKGLIMVS